MTGMVATWQRALDRITSKKMKNSFHTTFIKESKKISENDIDNNKNISCLGVKNRDMIYVGLFNK